MGWPKKMWGRKPTPKFKPEKPEFEDMGLFADTLRKLEEKEAALVVAAERIRNLEIALKAARADKYRAQAGRGHPYIGQEARIAHGGLNTLSEEDEKELFKMHREAKIDDQVDAWSKPVTEDSKEPTTRRGGFLSPVLRMCALLRGGGR